MYAFFAVVCIYQVHIHPGHREANFGTAISGSLHTIIEQWICENGKMINKRGGMHRKKTSIPSPCIRNCCLNEQDICVGCFRTLTDILEWGQADDTMRMKMLLNVAQRRKAYYHSNAEVRVK